MIVAAAVFRVYVFFATWCVPCRQELPQLAELAVAFDGRGVEFVLIAEDGPSTAANVPAFLARYPMPATLVYDEDSALMDRYNPAASMPFLAILDEADGVVWSHAGYQPGDERELAAELERLVAARGGDGEPAAGATDRLAWAVTAQSLGLWRRDDFRNLDDPAASGAVVRVDTSMSTRRYRASVRLDGAYLARSADDPRDLRPEKVSLSARLGSATVTAGDGYASFGHGLALSVRKIDPLGVDTSIRGGRVELEGRGLRATALAGVFNPQNIDTVELATFDDPRDWIAGLELEQRAGRLRLRQDVVASRLEGASSDGGDIDLGIGGASVDYDHGGVRAAVEAVGLVRQGMVAMDEVEWGHGAYGMIAVTRGTVTGLAEAKWYRRLAFGRAAPSLDYIEPPTLEREDQEIPGNADALGGRARGEWRRTPSTTYTLNALGYRYATDGGPAANGGLALHGYAGAEYHLEQRAAVGGTVGYRRESLPDGELKLHVVQLTADGLLELSSRWGLTAKWDHRSETKLASLGPYAFVRGLAVAGLTWNARVTLSLLHGYSTEAAARPTHYPGAELKVQLGHRGDLRAFGGRLAGGRLCVSGACRDIPPFEGVRLELSLRL